MQQGMYILTVAQRNALLRFQERPGSARERGVRVDVARVLVGGLLLSCDTHLGNFNRDSVLRITSQGKQALQDSEDYISGVSP